ncbi:MAG: galactose mutarotase [Clostridia bacterium]|nr:galactose mutarotase [Clostridia bacterium]
MITSKVFGKTKKGEEVLAFTLQDGEMKAVILNYGGIIQSIVVPDKNGNPTDVILGYNDVAGYENNGGYLGALIGRFGNRIGKGKMTVDGVEYQLYNNDRGNHLHGGKEGFDKKIWAHKIDGDALVLSILSPDGEENYPGNLKVTVTYTFQKGELKIQYHATTDKKTVVNLTNHAYFNMNGEGDGDASDNVLWIDCDRITPTNDTMIPVGGFKDVKGTEFDFNVPREIGRADFTSDDIDLKQGGGFDHCHVLKNKCGEYVLYATAESKKTGIKMSCYTDMPAVQFYAGNGMNQQGKTAFYGKRAGYCLETQAIPNNVNVPEYAALGSSYLDAGEVYEFTAAYKFETV